MHADRPARRCAAPHRTARRVPPAGAWRGLAATLVLCAAGLAQADGRGEVDAAMAKFLAARTWHASMHVSGGGREMVNEMDFAAPDRYRMQLAGMGTQYIVGDTMVMSMGGRTMRVPMPKGTLSKWRDPARIHDATAKTTVEALGADLVDGKPAKQYAIHNPDQDSEVRMWVGGDGYPLQIRSESRSGDKATIATIRYSRFNDPTIRVEAP